MLAAPAPGTISLADNPFAVLSAIVAPAILTNACSVLCLGTGNRIGRVVDRTRVVSSELSSLEPGSAECRIWLSQLERLQIRAQLLMKALRILYAALGGFAASALISVVGSVLSYYGQQLGFHTAAVVALAVGLFAVTALVVGCALMVRETRLALDAIAAEAELARRRFPTGQANSG